jgi:serine/threonine protein kinase
MGAHSVQAALIHFEDRTRRTALRNARAQIITDHMNNKSDLIFYSENGRRKMISLFGLRVMKIRLPRCEEDAVPSFIDNSICIGRNMARGVILAFPSEELLQEWCNRFCHAGCIMDDLRDQVTVLETHGAISLVRPRTNRTATDEDVLVFKATADDAKKKEIMNEAYLLLKLQHPRIPRVHGIYTLTFFGEPGLGLMLDYKAGSDLSTWIPDGGLPEWALTGIFAQIRDVLSYLRTRSIVHRDIKPSNVLCEKAEDGTMKVSLADFGLAAHAQDWDAVSVRCGTAGYIAPEIFDSQWLAAFSSPTDPRLATEKVLKTDIFSFGMLIYVTAFGTNPLLGRTEMSSFRKNARGLRMGAEAARLSADLADLIHRLTARSPYGRWSIVDAADHPWFGADLRALGFRGADEEMRGHFVAWEVLERVSRRSQD